MKEKFPELFEYSHCFNQKFITAIELHTSLLPERCFQLINHILNAHQIWNGRILNEGTFEVWEIHPFEDLEKINESNFLNSLKIIENSDLSQIISYRNSKGNLFENKAEDILFHIINHSTYHRGQIALLFRKSGVEPLVSDYIFHKRN